MGLIKLVEKKKKKKKKKKIPLGAAGNKFVEESTRLVQAFAEGSALESVSFWALMLMPSLLLQQPMGQPSHRQQTDCLQRRLLLWAAGNIDELLLEGRVIQTDLRPPLTRKHYDPSEGISRAFSQLMIQGKVKAALHLLSTQSGGEVLDPDAILPGGDNAEASPKTVLEMLRESTHLRVQSTRMHFWISTRGKPSSTLSLRSCAVIRSGMLHCIAREQQVRREWMQQVGEGCAQ